MKSVIVFRNLFKNKIYSLLIFLSLVGAFVYFYNLNWGAPFYFHPDERNIASSVSQLQFPKQMNPHFFAYGSLPIYIIYFTGLNINYLTHLLTPNPYNLNPNFELAIIISRFYSALFATLLIPILFVIARNVATKQSQTETEIAALSFGKLRIARNDATGLIAAFLAATSVGFIQFAHFGTFEMWLTFFSVLLFWICLQKITYKNILLMGLIFGVLVAIKISSLVLILLPLIVLFKNSGIIFFRFHKKTSFWQATKECVQNLLSFLIHITLLLAIASIIYFATNPFVIFDFPSFQNSMTYESTLALGTLPVFYTGEFYNTTPVIFQLIHVFPFLLNPLITILFVISYLYLLIKSVQKKQFSYFLLFAICSLLFFPQAFLFVKWIRYMVPTLPFIYLIIAITISDLSFRAKSRNPIPQRSLHAIITLVGMTSIVFAISYFITAFVHEDTRVAAKNFAIKNIPSNAQIISEVYDLGIVPFNNFYPTIALFNFYELDNNSPVINMQTLTQQLSATDIIILPSQRILKTRIINKDKFPNANAFYQSLTTNKFLYKKIYETPCDIFCKITYLGDPIYSYEQTANVFDRPTLFIFKKN